MVIFPGMPGRELYSGRRVGRERSIRGSAAIHMSDWTTPLYIRLPDQESLITVRGTGHAAALLADKWPVTHGPAFEHALASFAAVSEGHLLPDEAREAFVEAADAAGVGWLNYDEA
jgi:hypothetical protein